MSEQYWATRPGGVVGIPNSREEFDALEAQRYRNEPEVHAFAQFSRSRGLRVLEVGVGSGTDFIQWVRSGADAHGVDVTHVAVETTRRRLEVYGLKAQVQQARAEALPYKDNAFDLVYSFGVLHHVDDPDRAISEVIRVIKPGGRGKLMLYHRWSLVAIQIWIWRCLLRGKPWRSISWALARYMESPGTRAYRTGEVRAKLAAYPLKNAWVRSIHTMYDDLRLVWPIPWLPTPWPILASLVSRIFGWHRVGWFMLIEFTKT